MLDGALDFIRRATARTITHGDHLGDDATPDEIEPVVDPSWRIDNGGWLVAPQPTARLVHVPTVRTCKLVTPGPVMVVWHWTATKHGTAHGIAKRWAKFRRGVDRAASAHAIIAGSGTVYQLAPTTVGTWCQGGATALRFAHRGVTFRPADGPGTVSGNELAFSIELENVGEVRHTNGQWMGWPFGKDGVDGPIVQPQSVVKYGNKHYHNFTSSQLTSSGDVLRALVRTYPYLTREACSWTHAKIDPTRKTDPGPVWIERYLQGVLDYAFS